MSTQVAGRQVVVFTLGIGTCPETFKPFKVWGKQGRRTSVTNPLKVS